MLERDLSGVRVCLRLCVCCRENLIQHQDSLCVDLYEKQTFYNFWRVKEKPYISPCLRVTQQVRVDLRGCSLDMEELTTHWYRNRNGPGCFSRLKNRAILNVKRWVIPGTDRTDTNISSEDCRGTSSEDILTSLKWINNKMNVAASVPGSWCLCMLTHCHTLMG